MRKHDVRKWLHAILDLLPVILIPVFMIYSHRHTIDSGSITREEPSLYTLKQNVINGKPLYDLNEGEVLNVSGNFNIVANGSEVVYFRAVNDRFSLDFYSNFEPFNIEHVIYFSCNYDFNSYYPNSHMSIDDGFNGYEFTGSGVYSYTFSANNNEDIYISFSSEEFVGDYPFKLNNVLLFDLTQIFGSGNEPTKEEFESILTQDYYDYGVDYDVVYGTHSVTYDDSDIMSQLVYQLYNAVDKYFNMGNVFNLTGVYDWFNLNIFNGNAPISIYIVWNIVLYEFVMDLLFLLYGLFMWFIDMVEKIMDKPFKSIK